MSPGQISVQSAGQLNCNAESRKKLTRVVQVGKVVTDISNNMKAGVKGALLVIGAYIVTVVIAILIITVSVAFLVDTHSCRAVGRALMALWATMAALFLLSGIFVGIVTWRTIPGIVGRLITVAGYGVGMLATYILLAFGLMVAFNC